MKPSSHSILESLEPRLAPAGTVILSTAGGVLTITGDGVPNTIHITDMPNSGQWNISDDGSLTSFILNGTNVGYGVNIPAQTAIKASLGDGDDELQILPSLFPSSMLITGGISINAGKGHDDIYIGATASSSRMLTGAVTIDLGEGDDLLDITQAAVYSGAVKITGGLGNDTVRIDTPSLSADQVFQKGLAVNLGAGDDGFYATGERIAITGAFTVTAAGGVGLSPEIHLTVDQLMVDGVATLSSTGGNAAFQIGSSSTDTYQFSSGLKINGSAGDDTVTILGNHTVIGAVTMGLKDGINSVTVVANTVLAAGSFSVTGGAGNDSFLQDDNSRMIVNGALALSLGNGTNDWKADPLAELTAGSVSFTGGTGGETLNYAGASFRVLGAMTINTGTNGLGNIDLTPTVSGYVGGLLSFVGGAGNDDIDFNSPDIRIVTGLKFALGTGTNEVDTAGALLQIAGGITYTGGTGVDQLTVTNSLFLAAKAVTFTGGGSTGIDQLYLRPVDGTVGSVSYKGGSGTDYFILGAADATTTNRLTINGSVSGSGGAGTGFGYVIDTYIHGNYTYTNASINAPGSGELVYLKESTLNGVVNISLGAGASTVLVDDIFVRGNFTLNTGAGVDNVSLDTAPGTPSLSHYFGLVSINLGAGNDTISIGTNPVTANAGNNFYRNVKVDGGADVDTFSVLHAGSSNTYYAGSTLTQLNFP